MSDFNISDPLSEADITVYLDVEEKEIAFKILDTSKVNTYTETIFISIERTREFVSYLNQKIREAELS